MNNKFDDPELNKAREEDTQAIIQTGELEQLAQNMSRKLRTLVSGPINAKQIIR